MKLEYSDKLLENTKTSNFMKIHLVGAELSHVDRQAHMKKLMVAFISFSNAFTNVVFI